MNRAETSPALVRANATSGIERTLWLVLAIDVVVSDDVVLIGGSAVNLHTGVYRPTDIDMSAFLDARDREALEEIGFRHFQGDHFVVTMADGEVWPVEFPTSSVDGQIQEIEMAPGETIKVITLESLMIDRLIQATDRTGVTEEEAVRLGLATAPDMKWAEVIRELRLRDSAEPGLRLWPTWEMVAGTLHSKGVPRQLLSE